MTIRHIVFDIGKVLLHYDPELAYLELIQDAKERQQFLAEICTPEWNIEQDRGRSWAEAEELLISSHPDKEMLIRAWRKNWHMMVPHAIDGSVTLLRWLIAQGHDVTMLTNFAADTFIEAQARFDFLNESRGVTVSAEIGLLKPQREIYETHVKAFGLDPSTTLFIDDSAKNVEGAIAAGWHAVLFTDPQQLRADLAGFGFHAPAAAVSAR